MMAVLWLCIHECEANLLLYIAHTDQYDRLCSGCLCTNDKQDMLYLAHTDLYDGSVVAAYKEMLSDVLWTASEIYHVHKVWPIQ